jgi:hypothetical protein
MTAWRVAESLRKRSAESDSIANFFRGKTIGPP